METVTRSRDVILGRLRDLCFVLVEIEGGIELRLAHEEFFQPRFVVEGLVGLRLIIGESFAEARAAFLFLVGEFIQRAERVFDALHGADRIFGIEVCGIEALASDEKVRHRRSIEGKAREPFSLAQNLKAPERSTRLKSEIVPPCQHSIGQSFGGFGTLQQKYSL